MGEPSITTSVEPREGLTFVSYLKCAPLAIGGQETGYLNLMVTIVNTGAAPLRVIKAEVSVPNSSTAPKPWSFQLPMPPAMALAKNQTVQWSQNDDYIFAIPPGAVSLLVRIWTDTATDPYLIQSSLMAPSGHRIPLSSISATLRYATSPSAIRDSSGSSGTTTPSCVRAMTGYRALVSTWT